MTFIQRESDFRFTGPEYGELYKRSDATLFQHPVWLDHLYGSLAPAVDAEPLVITGRETAGGPLQFVLPLARTRRRFVRRVEFADLGVCDYAKPVMAPEDRDGLRTNDVRSAVHSAIGDADILQVDKIPADPTGMAWLLETDSSRKHDYEAHLLTLGSSFQSWRADSYPKVARRLDKQRSQLGRKGQAVDMRELHTAAEVDDAFVALREFRKARFAGRRAIDLVQDPRYFAFYRGVARESAERGGPGSTTILTVNGETAAVSFNLADDDRDLGLLLGFDYARYRRYTMGLMMVEEIIAASIRNGKRYLDMTIGHDGYKSEFGAEATAMYSVHVPVTARGRVAETTANGEAAARRAAKRALAYQQRRFPKLDSGKALRRIGLG